MIIYRRCLAEVQPGILKGPEAPGSQDGYGSEVEKSFLGDATISQVELRATTLVMVPSHS